MRSFAKRFNSLRLEGETQKEFADRLGLTQASISRYLSGHSPDRESLFRIATRTGTSVDWLLSGREAEPELPDKDARTAARVMTNKELLDTGLSFLDHIKDISPEHRQALKLMVKDVVDNREHFKQVMEYWNGLRLQDRPARHRRKSGR